LLHWVEVVAPEVVMVLPALEHWQEQVLLYSPEETELQVPIPPEVAAEVAGQDQPVTEERHQALQPAWVLH
jgi:hypothetical protein